MNVFMDILEANREGDEDEDEEEDENKEADDRTCASNEYQCINECGFTGRYRVVAKHELTCKLSPNGPGI